TEHQRSKMPRSVLALATGGFSPAWARSGPVTTEPDRRGVVRGADLLVVKIVTAQSIGHGDSKCLLALHNAMPYEITIHHRESPTQYCDLGPSFRPVTV